MIKYYMKILFAHIVLMFTWLSLITMNPFDNLVAHCIKQICKYCPNRNYFLSGGNICYNTDVTCYNTVINILIFLLCSLFLFNLLLELW